MKEKNILDMLFSDDDSDIEYISGAYPAAGDKQKERIYKISKRKYNIQKNADEHDGEYIKQAEGVEQYRRPKWYRGACVAAAALVLMGGAVGTAMLAGTSQLFTDTGHDNMASLSDRVIPDKMADETAALIDDLLGNLQLYDGLNYGIGTDSADQLIYYVPIGQEELYTEELDDSAVNYVDPALGKQSREPVASFYDVDFGEQSDNDSSELDRQTEKEEQRTSYIIRHNEENSDGYAVAYDNDSITYQGDYNVYTYSKVTDPRFDTMEELKDFASSFMVVNNEREFGGDFSEYPSETVFESSFVLRDFIEYDGSVYSHIMSGEQFMRFDEYEIISTDYRFDVPDNADENYCMTDGDFTFDRVYRIDDDNALYCSFTVIKDETDSRHKISSWSISEGVNEFEKNNDEPVEQETDEPDKQEEYNAVWLYNGLPIVQDIDHALSIIEDEQKAYEERGIFKVDTRPYINMLLNAETDEELNTIENKSYIYHMMLNSVDYYETAQGSMKCDGTEIQFRTDLTDQYAYMYEVKDGLEMEYYCIDGVMYNKILPSKQYTFVNSYNVVEHIPDYARVFKTASGDYYCQPLNEITHTGREALFPQTIAMYDLCEFDQWSILGIETRLGRQCAVIEGTAPEIMPLTPSYFKIWVDIETGIALLAYDGSSENEPYIEVHELELNAPIEKIPFDATGYEFFSSTVGLRTDKSDD